MKDEYNESTITFIRTVTIKVCTYARFPFWLSTNFHLRVFTFYLKWDLIEHTEPQLAWFMSKPQSLWHIHKEAKQNVHDESNQRQAVYVIITGVNINYSLTICHHSWIAMGHTTLPIPNNFVLWLTTKSNQQFSRSMGIVICLRMQYQIEIIIPTGTANTSPDRCLYPW